jgi:hypothetical protein
MASPLFDPVSVALVGSGAVQRLAVVDGCTSPVNFLAKAAELKIIAGKGGLGRCQCCHRMRSIFTEFSTKTTANHHTVS